VTEFEEWELEVVYFCPACYCDLNLQHVPDALNSIGNPKKSVCCNVGGLTNRSSLVPAV
jgi:hypothetical protein